MERPQKIYISVPVNISRNIIMGVREQCPDSEVFSSSKKYYYDDLIFLEHIRKGRYDEVPDMMVSIRPELSWSRDVLQSSGIFDSDFAYPVNDIAGNKAMTDSSCILKPIFIMPLIIFFNTALENPPTSWKALLDKKYRGRIICTHEQTPPAVFMQHVYSSLFGKEGRNFTHNYVHYRGLPIDVNKAVSSGEYDIGIMPVSFARFSRDKSASFCWPEEGALPLMQVMVMKKNFSDECRKAAEFLLSEPVQKIFSNQAGFIPATSGVPMPETFTEYGEKLWLPDIF